jgi:hypothetical protein
MTSFEYEKKAKKTELSLIVFIITNKSDKRTTLPPETKTNKFLWEGKKCTHIISIHSTSVKLKYLSHILCFC